MTETKSTNHHSERQQSPFLNGLLIGLILGVAIALLFTTKKGKKIVKALTEEGLDSLSELRKRLDNIEFMLDEGEVDEYYVQEQPQVEELDKPVKKAKDTQIEDLEEDVAPAKRGSKRRLFRGISRKN